MAQPFDYTIPSPQNAFQSSFVFGQQIAARQAVQEQAQQQAQQQQQQAQQARADMQMVYDQPTPENISKFYLAYPAYKEQFESARQPLNDAAKAADLDFSSRMLSLLTNDATEQANELIQSRIQALKNSPGKEQEAAATEAIAGMITKAPQAARALLSLKMGAIDPKLYETMFGRAEMTGFQKDLAAAGVDPNSAEGVSLARKKVELAVDPIVQMPTPDGAQFIGPQSEYNRRFGGGGAAPAKMPTPFTKQQYDALPPGSEYFDPRDSKVKRKGNSPMAGIPAPTLDASGRPTMLTQQQYRAIVQTKGKAKTDAYLQANNITVSER